MAADSIAGDPPARVDIRRARGKLNQVPDEYRFTYVEPKGHKGICLARDREVRDVLDYFSRQWKADAKHGLQRNDCIAYLITNAPGAGKTTLREECLLKQLKSGVTVIELGADELTDDARFIAGLFRHTKPEAAQPLPEDTIVQRAYGRLLTSKWTAPVAGAALDVTFQLPGLGTMAGATISILQGRRERLAKAVVAQKPQTPSEALQLVSEHHEGQFIVSVDECHGWGSAGADRGTLSTNLAMLTNPTVRASNHVRGGGVLLSGLGDASDYFDGLGLTRARVLWLGPLTETAAAAVMRYYLKSEGGDHGYPTTLQEEWISRLTASFSHWPQHSSVAGAVVALTLQQAAADKIAPDDDDALAQCLEYATINTAEIVGQLYQQRLDQARQSTNSYTPTMLAALANVTGGPMPLAVVNLVLQRSIRVAGGTTTSDESRLQRMRNRLKRAGVLGQLPRPIPTGEDAEAEFGFTVHEDEDTLFGIGIPSLRDYIVQGQRPKRMAEAETLARIDLAHAEAPFAAELAAAAVTESSANEGAGNDSSTQPPLDESEDNGEAD